MRLLTLVALLATACLPDDRPAGLRHTPPGDGPQIIFDLSARPFPEIPFPNDVLTRPDLTSPTRLRLNLSAEGPTAMERALRATAMELDGFGTFAPLTVRFSRPLDLAALDGRGRDYADDPVLLIDVTDGPTFGDRIFLDLGRGNFPLALPDPDAYFPQDPRAGEGNLFFETVDEDRDHDGVLSPVEDTDGDGVLDRPNLATPGGPLVTFYESETDTLILRPIVPLRPAHTYAVVITERVVGRDGQPVRSPFDFVHHTRQTDALRNLEPTLAPYGVGLDEVAFAWTFTTQSTVSTLVELRRGLAGAGPFAALAELFPPRVTTVDSVRDSGAERKLLRHDELARVLGRITAPDCGGEPVPLAAYADTYDAVDYLVSGEFVTPYLLSDTDGHALDRVGGYPSDSDERFRLDFETGETHAVGQPVPFWCVVPRARAGATPPFPVVLFAHALGANRVHSLVFAGYFARWGFATCAIDAVGHGTRLEKLAPQGADAAESRAILEEIRRQMSDDGLGPLVPVLEGTRSRDLDNDGVRDDGADTFTADALHSRDVVRQTALDWMQFLQVLRAFDGELAWSHAGVEGDIAGDFNGDGTVDLGGPTVAYHFTGIGYGGLIAGVVGGVEPYLTSIAPIAGGGGLIDIGTRSTRAGVREAVILRALGPLIVGAPAVAETTPVSFVVPGPDHAVSLPFAELRPLVAGDRVVVTNLRSGESRAALVSGEGAFRVAVAADSLDADETRVRAGIDPTQRDVRPPLRDTAPYGDPLRLEVIAAGWDGAAETRATHVKHTVDKFLIPTAYEGVTYADGAPLVAVSRGWGQKRQTPDFRRFFHFMQVHAEPADPINYARHWFQEPIDYGPLAPGAPVGVNALIVLTAGDTDVPIATGLSLARAAGLLPFDAPAPGHAESANQLLIDRGVTEGLPPQRSGVPLADPDNLSDGTDGFDAPRFDPPLRLTRRRSDGGEVGLRIALVEPQGAHGCAVPRAGRPFDAQAYLANLLGRFFTTGKLDHARCLTAGGGCPEQR